MLKDTVANYWIIIIYNIIINHCMPREDEGANRINPLYRPYTHRNPSKVNFRSSLRSVAPRRVE